MMSTNLNPVAHVKANNEHQPHAWRARLVLLVAWTRPDGYWVVNSLEESVWFPLSSIARTSQK